MNSSARAQSKVVSWCGKLIKRIVLSRGALALEMGWDSDHRPSSPSLRLPGARNNPVIFVAEKIPNRVYHTLL